MIGIGWDVGGWLGNHQAVAMVRVGDDGSVKWLGRPTRFRLNALRGVLTPKGLIDLVGGDPALLELERVVVAIDAPLGFPAAFCDFVAGWPFGSDTQVPDSQARDKEIDNPLAYRATDQHVEARFQKKPISAPFDKLGNCATVAMAHVRSWRTEHGFKVLPMDAQGEREIIEVYPALVKANLTGGKGTGVADWFKRWMGTPPAANEPSDELDAAICARIAACRGGGADLPWLVSPHDVVGAADVKRVMKEGWIFYPQEPRPNQGGAGFAGDPTSPLPETGAGWLGVPAHPCKLGPLRILGVTWVDHYDLDCETTWFVDPQGHYIAWTTMCHALADLRSRAGSSYSVWLEPPAVRHGMSRWVKVTSVLGDVGSVRVSLAVDRDLP
jgi:hypothetical protein